MTSAAAAAAAAAAGVRAPRTAAVTTGTQRAAHRGQVTSGAPEGSALVQDGAGDAAQVVGDGDVTQLALAPRALDRVVHGHKVALDGFADLTLTPRAPHPGVLRHHLQVPPAEQAAERPVGEAEGALPAPAFGVLLVEVVHGQGVSVPLEELVTPCGILCAVDLDASPLFQQVGQGRAWRQSREIGPVEENHRGVVDLDLALAFSGPVCTQHKHCIGHRVVDFSSSTSELARL